MSALPAYLPSKPSTSTTLSRPQERVACFSILAEAEPGVMPRVLELFAKRSLVPQRWVSDRIGHKREDLSIDLQVAGLDQRETDYIASCLRQIWGVQTVMTSEKAWDRLSA